MILSNSCSLYFDDKEQLFFCSRMLCRFSALIVLHSCGTVICCKEKVFVKTSERQKKRFVLPIIVRIPINCIMFL